ncbi:hypothetical protein I4U23_018968 [Adineta vaga]|nr:hypothetical protein I4U23_018968 [Adineta vaga]
MDKQPGTSNIQGLDNVKPLPQGTPSETIEFDANQQILTSEHQPTGKIVREQSDIDRLQDEDFRTRVNEIASGQHHATDDINEHQSQLNVTEYDPVVHPDAKHGRLQLSIRFNHENNQLIIQIIDAQGIIRPEQIYSPEMDIYFSLIENDSKENPKEKQSRVIVENAAVLWKEPLLFSDTYEKFIKETLHVLVENHTDPSVPRDREICIPLNNLQRDGNEIKQWFNLQFVKAI